ncbi:hypothetical protein [Pectobacterium versatile]|uniref:hypothetical protein n=1 Tax=Pectobacterium versatile TaxID=2488639 RepID=UPI001BB2E77B|nr:hypothetical protein [Pectobacterium versatile]
MAITYEYHYGNGGFILSEPQQKELRTLLDKQLTQSGTGAKSLAVPLYDKILSYLPVPDINMGEYFKVYTWLQGAREVNNDSSVYSVFIRRCSGQQKLATALEFFQNNLSDSFGVKPPLY